MNLRFIFFFFVGTSALSLSCSVYETDGRKKFESAASSQVQSLQSPAPLSQDADTEPDQGNETCWNQPANEPLWHVDSESKMIVNQLPRDEIQVCLQAL